MLDLIGSIMIFIVAAIITLALLAVIMFAVVAALGVAALPIAAAVWLSERIPSGWFQERRTDPRIIAAGFAIVGLIFVYNLIVIFRPLLGF